jgi:predicted TPR repeat methyltransferase
MASYDVFAPFYDAVQGDRAEHGAYIRSLIEKHHPQAATLVEFACGTGSVLKQLRPYYRVTGIDLSEEMLEVAAEKVPGVALFRADMTKVDLGERFDVVLCAYDSINHLVRFADWKAVFARAREHLRDRGLFVFDINTKRQLETLVNEPPWVRWFGDGNLLVLDVSAAGRGIANWEIRVFERIGEADYRLHAEDIREIAFPAEQIRAALRKRFPRVWTYDARRSRPSAHSERLHFVCRAP